MKQLRAALKAYCGCTLSAVVGLSAMVGAHADDNAITTKFSGYGTLAGTVSSDANAGFRAGWWQGKGAGSDLDLGVDSRLGLQGVTTFSPNLSATGQLLIERRRTDSAADSNKDFDIGVEWLYGQYNITSDLNVRLGRVVLPAFMISDSRNVGYAQPWLRAPLEVYAGMPLSNLDGVQLTWRENIGPAILTLQPSFGSSSNNISVGQGGQPLFVLAETSKHVMSLNASLEYGSWTARVGQVRGTSPLSMDILGPKFGTTLDPINYNMKDRFTTAGLQFDNGSALFMTEFARRRQNGLPGTPPASYSTVTVPTPLSPTTPVSMIYAAQLAGKPLAASTAWYVAGGWHFSQFLPVLAIGQFKDDLTRTKYHSVDASLRYDVRSNVALKAQISSYDARDGNAFLNASTQSKHITVYAMGVDFVF